MTVRRKLSDEEREQRRAQDREPLKAAAEQLLTSEGWRRWVEVRSRAGLARLSLNNRCWWRSRARRRRSWRASRRG